LSTFERCWLSGATGLAQRTGDTRDLFALRSPGSVSPLCPTCAPVKANGAARKARERDKRATETRLRGWACETRTQKCRRKISLCKVGEISGNRGEFWQRRAFALELRGWRHAARVQCQDLGRMCCAGRLVIEAHT